MAHIDRIVSTAMRAYEVSLQALSMAPAIFDVANLKGRFATIGAGDLLGRILHQIFGGGHPFSQILASRCAHLNFLHSQDFIVFVITK